MSAVAFEIRIEPATSPAATALTAALHAELVRRYPGAPNTGLDMAAFAAAGGVLAVGYADGEPACCGGFRPHADDTVEIKRMFVAPAWRGRGLSRRLLAFLEVEAAQRGFTRAVLETGIRQPEAIALYASAGWQQIPKHGRYADDPLSVCFEKCLRR